MSRGPGRRRAEAESLVAAAGPPRPGSRSRGAPNRIPVSVVTLCPSDVPQNSLSIRLRPSLPRSVLIGHSDATTITVARHRVTFFVPRSRAMLTSNGQHCSRPRFKKILRIRCAALCSYKQKQLLTLLAAYSCGPKSLSEMQRERNLSHHATRSAHRRCRRDLLLCIQTQRALSSFWCEDTLSVVRKNRKNLVLITVCDWRTRSGQSVRGSLGHKGCGGGQDMRRTPDGAYLRARSRRAEPGVLPAALPEGSLRLPTGAEPS